MLNVLAEVFTQELENGQAIIVAGQVHEDVAIQPACTRSTRTRASQARAQGKQAIQPADESSQRPLALLSLSLSLPGRNSAGSNMSGRDVAATTATPVSGFTPSISVSNWLTTRSVTPVLSPACPRRGAIASTSSRKSTQGAAARARANTRRTAASDEPMYLPRTSGPLTRTRRAPIDLVTAVRLNVLPHPGKP